MTNRPAALKNARIRKRTECTGLRAPTTITPDAIATPAQRSKKNAWTVRGRPRALAGWVVDGCRARERIADGKEEGRTHLPQDQRSGGMSETQCTGLRPRP